MRALLLIGRPWKRAKSKDQDFRLRSVTQKRLCLSALIMAPGCDQNFAGVLSYK